MIATPCYSHQCQEDNYSYISGSKTDYESSHPYASNAYGKYYTATDMVSEPTCWQLTNTIA